MTVQTQAEAYLDYKQAVRRLMREGYIKLFCEVCKDSTWHRPIKPFPITHARMQTIRIKGQTYKGTYECVECHTEKHFKIDTSGKALRRLGYE